MSNLPVPTSHIPHFHLPRTALVLIDGAEYAVCSSDEHGHVMTRREAPQILETFTHDRLYEIQRAGQLELRANFYEPYAARERMAHEGRTLIEMPDKTLRRMTERKLICDAFLEEERQGKVTRSKASTRKFINEHTLRIIEAARSSGRHGSEDIVIKRPMSPTTLLRHLNAYEAANRNPHVLCDHYATSGNRSARFHTEEMKIMQTVAESYMSRLKPSKRKCYQDLEIRIKDLNTERIEQGKRPLVLPSRSAFERHLERQDKFLMYAGRTSLEAAKKKFYPVQSGLEAERALQAVQMDGCNIPVQAFLESLRIWDQLSGKTQQVLVKRRMMMTVALDVATRCVLGVVVSETASAATSIETLRMIMSDKQGVAKSQECETPFDYCGRPEVVYVDNGPENANHEFYRTMILIGSELVFPPAGMPELRAFIERFFGTIHTDLFSRMSGRTFANIKEKGDYDSENEASLLLSELARLVLRWIVDVYHNTPHGGLYNETPRQAWLRLTETYPIIPPPSPNEMRHIFGTLLTRKVGNHGVRIMGLNYQSRKLQELRRRKGDKGHTIRLDREDIGRISVETEPGTWLTVPCVRDGFNGVSADHWMGTLKALRRRHANIAKLSEDIVFRAIREIEATIRNAEQRAGVANPVLSAEQIDKFDREVAKTFDMLRPEDALPLIDDVTLPTPAQPSVEATGAPVKSEPKEVKRFTMED